MRHPVAPRSQPNEPKQTIHGLRQIELQVIDALRGQEPMIRVAVEFVAEPPMLVVRGARCRRLIRCGASKLAILAVVTMSSATLHTIETGHEDMVVRINSMGSALRIYAPSLGSRLLCLHS